MMTVFMITLSENLPFLEDREAELLELCFLAKLLNLWQRREILKRADAALMVIDAAELNIPPKPPVLELRSFNLISPQFVYHHLQFKLPDLIEVFKALNFPPNIKV
eukprot:scaffold109656_cov63-Attheya_sp.AAC.2